MIRLKQRIRAVLSPGIAVLVSSNQDGRDANTSSGTAPRPVCLFPWHFWNLETSVVTSIKRSTRPGSMITSTWAFSHLFTHFISVSIMLKTLTLEDEPVSGSESETEEQISSPTAQSARQEQNVFFKNLLALASLSNIRTWTIFLTIRTDSQKLQKTWPSKN